MTKESKNLDGSSRHLDHIIYSDNLKGPMGAQFFRMSTIGTVSLENLAYVDTLPVGASYVVPLHDPYLWLVPQILLDTRIMASVG